MEYRMQNAVKSSYRNNSGNSGCSEGSMSYESQRNLYERVVKYSQAVSGVEYSNEKEPPKIY